MSTAPESQLPPTSGTTAALERPRWWLPRDAPAVSVLGPGRGVRVVVLGSPGCDLPGGRTRVCTVPGLRQPASSSSDVRALAGGVNMAWYSAR